MTGRSEVVEVTLTAEQAAMIRAAVAAGGYLDSGDVVRDALRQWQQRRDGGVELEALGRLFDEGETSGLSPITTAEELLHEVRQRRGGRVDLVALRRLWEEGRASGRGRLGSIEAILAEAHRRADAPT